MIALQALASTIDDEELADLKDQFSAIDVDKNGAISLEEMRQVKVFLHYSTWFTFWYHVSLSLSPLVLTWMVFMQALAKDLPWKMKEPRVLEILQAVSISPFGVGNKKLSYYSDPTSRNLTSIPNCTSLWLVNTVTF